MSAKSALILLLLFWATAHVVSFYWLWSDALGVPQCRGNCFVVSELARQLFGEPFLIVFLGLLLPLFADLGLGAFADSWRRFVLVLVFAVLGFQIEGVLVDRFSGRLSDPFWMKDYTYRFEREIFWRFAFPAIAVIVGGLAGALKRKYLFAAHIRHA